MKKTLTILIALLTAALMLTAFTACDGKKEDAKDNTVSNVVQEDTFMKEIFEKITTNEQYTEWKQMNPESEITEKLDVSVITFTVKNDNQTNEGEETTNDAAVLNGEYVFTHDGDYVVFTAQDAERMSNPFLIRVETAVAEYYGLDFVTVNEYVNKVLTSGEESKYYIEDADSNTIKMYAAAKWEIE